MVKENKKNIDDLTYGEVKKTITIIQPLLNKFDASIEDVSYLFNKIKVKDLDGLWREIHYGKDYNIFLKKDCIYIIPNGETRDLKTKHKVKFAKSYKIPSDANLRAKMENVIYPYWYGEICEPIK